MDYQTKGTEWMHFGELLCTNAGGFPRYFIWWRGIYYRRSGSTYAVGYHTVLAWKRRLLAMPQYGLQAYAVLSQSHDYSRGEEERPV